MNERQPVQYTVRDVSAEVDLRLREAAALEEVSLNQAALRALARGLGVDGTPVRYRSLGGIVRRAPKTGIKAWRQALREQDKVNPADWR
jgi:HEAT repeat protein